MNEKRLHVITFGCQMNVRESERIAEIMTDHHYKLTDSLQEADVILLNTCSIRGKAEHKVYSNLGRLKPLKEQKPDLIIGVGGCVAQIAQGDILAHVPHVDFVFGSRNYMKLPELIEQARKTRRQLIDTSNDMIEDFIERKVLHQGPAAFVSIMTGCNKYCSFCIVPLAKGKEVSRHSQAILAEIRSLVEQGIKEVTLLGQTVNSYGRGLDEAITFEDLIDQISAISGIERIRFTSPYPGELTPRLLEQFRDNPKLCHHIHLPVQSGSNPILKRMRRRYTREDYLQSIADLKKYCPDIAITSDFIVGFPGETDADFQETLSLIRLVGFDTSYSFKYSIRPETKAAEFSDQVPEEVKLRRLSELQEIQQEITLQKHKSLIESIQEVLVEGPGIRPRQVTGRTSGNKIVNFAGPASMGELIRVKIIRACKNSLVGLMMTNSESSGSFRNSTVTTEF